MFQDDLSEKEKMVLYNLVKHPGLNDRELSEKIGLKISTLTSIKNRLRKGEYYRTIRIPDLTFMGFEVLWVRYGNYEHIHDPDEINRRETEIIKEFDLNTFYAIQDGHTFFTLNISKNFTEAQQQIRLIEKDFQTRGYIENFNYLFFPLELTQNLFDFDYSMLLKKRFNIKDEWNFHLDGLSKPDNNIANLRKNDVAILNNLIRFPELPDTSIANEIGTTRQAVSRIRKKFENDGIIKTMRIPNIKTLGFEILVFSYQNHSPVLPTAEIMDVIEDHIISNLPLVYLNSTELESFCISIFADFYDLQKMKEVIMAKTLREGFVSKVPEFFLFSVPNMKVISDLDYTSLLDPI